MQREWTKDEVLSFLHEGLELWYLYVDGEVAIHNKDGEPMRAVPYCPITVFLALQSEGVIKKVRSNATGYPHYANASKSDVYKLSET